MNGKTIAPLLLLMTLLATWPLLANLEIYDQPEQAPGHKEGAYIDLPSGRTHYVREGSGPPLLLMAGLTGNYSVWDRLRPLLAEKNTVYVIDSFGRGFSERRDDYAYDRQLYRQQLADFVAALAVSEVALAGTSMGGAIMIDYAAHNIATVRALVVIDSAGLPFATPALRGILDWPGLGEYAIAVAMPLLLSRGFAEGFADPLKADDRFRERYNRSASIAGFRRAVLESIRHMPLHDLEPEIRAIAAAGIPTQIFWGRQDQVVPISVFEHFRKLWPKAEGIVIDNAKHMPHAEHPEIVGPNMAAFLQRAWQN